MKQKAISSVTLILVGNMLTTYNNIGSGWTSTITAIIGFVLFFIGLGQLNSFLDEPGQKGLSMLKNSAILGIVALIIHIIPLLGGIIAGILYLIAFIIQLVGLLQLQKSTTLGTKGAAGISNLLIAMGLMIIGSLIGILPFAGGTINALISLIAFMLILLGWLKIQEGIIENEINSDGSLT
jgi:uncharacterized membrane protein